LPKVHIAMASIEKIVPTLADAAAILRVLARSATGQDISAYTTFSTGPRRPGDGHGPEEFHVVLLDGGRSAMLGGEFRDMLRCIKCAACMNHCPVYGAVGGHAYGSVYPGPMGAVLSPALMGLAEAHYLPEASSLCGKCAEVCPVRIPLPDLLRHWRMRAQTGGEASVLARLAVRMWAFWAGRPALYRAAAGIKFSAWAWMGRRRGSFRWIPFMGRWTATKDFPAPEGGTFVGRWSRGERPR
jgi:L-lactate dehydrogenase complex protein LldF